LRILFLESHPMWIHGLPNGFKDAGHDVMVSGPLTEENVPLIISTFSPDLIMTMGWGPENKRHKQEWIKKYVKASRVPHAYWSTEDPTHTQTFSLPYIKKVQPNFVFTICSSMVDFYRNMGFKSAHLDFGFHESVHHPTKVYDNYVATLAIVANAYPRVFELYPSHYRLKSIQTLVCPVLAENLRIDFWGREWTNMESILNKKIPNEWAHGYLDYTEAKKVYNSAEIIIGLQNHPTQLTQRTYEVLGSRGFLLTNDTPEIRRLFQPGKDLVVSSSPESTLQLIQYYLKHPKEKEEIRKQGQLSVANHSYRHRAEYIVTTLQEQKILPIQEVSKANKTASKLVGWGNTTIKQITFTYDAGADADGAKDILDVLKKHGVSCTFFLTGEWIEKFPELSRRIATEGHEIGNHSYNHPDFKQLSRNEMIKQVKDCHSTIFKIIGQKPSNLFRPPYGSIEKSILQAVGEAGYEYTIYWSLDTLDWKQPSADEIVERILTNISNGDIVLMHLSGYNTAKASDLAIQKLKERGFMFGTVSDALKNIST
jgi:spore maturation protein CgeB